MLRQCLNVSGNKMNPPEIFSVTFMDLNGKPIENLLVYFTLFANKKNDYSIGPFLSDINGEIKLSKSKLEDEIKKSRELFIMDYSSDLEDCKQELGISIDDMKDIEIRLKKINNFYPETHSFLKELSGKASNSKYICAQLKIIPKETNNIHVSNK